MTNPLMERDHEQAFDERIVNARDAAHLAVAALESDNLAEAWVMLRAAQRDVVRAQAHMIALGRVPDVRIVGRSG